MCGIVGVYSFTESSSSSLIFIKWANATMVRRGPDSEGIWTNEKNYSSGFRRLAIRDLSPEANQPMVSVCRNYVLTFNGELYNTDQLRVELINRGVQFKTTSDTEILLYSIIHFGAERTLHRLDGIFAFAFYDVRLNKLVLARDRAGVKPLYYGYTAEGLVYSSQYDHIINHPFLRNKNIDEGALGTYLQLGYMAEGRAIFSDTYFLPHGHYLEIQNGSVSELISYFDYPVQLNNSGIEDICSHLSGAVESQLISDVPVGTFMSGGIDSPLVSCLANKFKPIKSFNIGVNDPEFDESKFALEYAKTFKLDHYLKMISEKDLLEAIQDNTIAFSEPFADYSSLPTLVLSKFARQQVTVALSGDGGDELFWGYPRNRTVMNQLPFFTMSRSRLLLKALFEKLTKANPRTVSGKLVRYKTFPEFYYQSLFVTGGAYWVPRIFKGEPKQPYFYDRVLQQGDDQHDFVTRMNIVRKLEFDLHLQRILLKVDRASMFHSLEVRVPLLSNSMINESTRYSFEDCLVNGQGKFPLRKALAGYAGEGLTNLPKRGFVVPIDKWIRGSMRNEFKEKILNMPSPLANHFKLAGLEQLLRKHNDNSENLSWMIWSLYTLSCWFSKFVDQKVN